MNAVEAAAFRPAYTTLSPDELLAAQRIARELGLRRLEGRRHHPLPVLRVLRS